MLSAGRRFFIRLTGCPLRCVYCDTEYAFYGGEWRTVGELLETARGSGVPRVCVTGGEPLAQQSCLDLLTALCDAGFAVSLETSGAMDVGEVDPRVSRVVDIKTPDSGESARNRMDNLGKLTARDQVKIVICSRRRLRMGARALASACGTALPCQVLFSPSFGQIEPRELAEWILADRLDVRLQVQLHKLLWGEERGDAEDRLKDGSANCRRRGGR